MAYGYNIKPPQSPWSRPTPYGSAGGPGLRPDQRPGTPMPLATGRITSPKRVSPWERMGIPQPRAGPTQRQRPQAGDRQDEGAAMLALIARMLTPQPSILDLLGRGISPQRQAGAAPYDPYGGISPLELHGPGPPVDPLWRQMLPPGVSPADVGGQAAPQAPILSLIELLRRYQPAVGLGAGQWGAPGDRPRQMI